MAIPAVVLIAYLSFWAGSLLTFYIMERLNAKLMRKLRSGSGTMIGGGGKGGTATVSGNGIAIQGKGRSE